MKRRDFLNKSIKGTTGLFTISVLPLGLVACSKDKKNIDTSAMVNLGSLNELLEGEFPKKKSYSITIKDAWTEQEKQGFVYINKNKKENSLIIMSPICTHLGCTAGDAEVSMQQKGIRFYCPCHGGQYNEFGVNVGGPPPRPLDIFESYIQEGNVYISVLNPIKREKK